MSDAHSPMIHYFESILFKGLIKPANQFQIKIKSNLFIVTHYVHKCTDGEIQDSVPWQYKQHDMRNVQYR